jgi:hypothetical protein
MRVLINPGNEVIIQNRVVAYRATAELLGQRVTIDTTRQEMF